MADCCSKVQAELAALRAEVARIPRVNEQEIIRKSIAGAEALIMPSVGFLILQRLAPVERAIALVEGKLADVAAKAVNAASTASQALSKAGNALSSATDALSKYAALAAAVVGVVAALAVLNILGGRIDTLENAVSNLSNNVSTIFGLLGYTKNVAEKALESANIAYDQAITARNEASNALSAAVRAQGTANNAEYIANIANNKISSVEQKAETAATLATQANANAQNAYATATDAISTASNAAATASNAQSTAGNALSAATSAASAANQAQARANEAANDASNALNIANAAKKMAESLSSQGNNTNISGIIGALNAQIAAINNIANAALGAANNAASQAQIALGLGSAALGQISNVAGNVGNISNTANQALNLSKINNGVVTNPAIANAQAIPIGKINGLEKQINQIQQRVGNPAINPTLQKEIADIKTKLGEQDRVNKEAIPKIDKILQSLGNVPGITAQQTLATIKPNLLTVPQVAAAAATGVCQTSQPGGCLGKKFDNLGNDLKNNLKNLADQLPDALDGAVQGAQMVLLTRIDRKLGAEIIGGVSGAMKNIANNQFVQAGLNVATYATTLHNALMLSNDLTVTLFSIFDNVLKISGIQLKNEEGQNIGLSQFIGSWFSGVATSIIGSANLTALQETWAKASRIYQASINVLNAFQSATSTILNALEITIGRIGKIGNALRKSGEVLENAYRWMNPQPKVNRLTTTLENLQQGASTIQMVTQAPLDVANALTELQNANTEFVKAFKEDDKPENQGTPDPEPDKLKADETAKKTASAGKQMTDETFDPDEGVA